MEEGKGEVGEIQRQGQRRYKEAIGKSYPILSKSSDEMGVNMSERSQDICSLKNRHSNLGKRCTNGFMVVADIGESGPVEVFNCRMIQEDRDRIGRRPVFKRMRATDY